MFSGVDRISPRDACKIVWGGIFLFYYIGVLILGVSLSFLPWIFIAINSQWTYNSFWPGLPEIDREIQRERGKCQGKFLESTFCYFYSFWVVWHSCIVLQMDVFNTFIELLRQTGNVTKGQIDINELRQEFVSNIGFFDLHGQRLEWMLIVHIWCSPRWLLKQEVAKIIKSINRQLREKSVKTKVKICLGLFLVYLF